MSPAPRALLFDAVGTLIALREPVGETYARVAAEQGLALSAWRLDDAFQRVIARASPCVVTGAGRAAAERDAWHDIVRQTFLAADSAQRLPDFESAFDSLFAHYGSAAAWSARPGACEALPSLRRAGLRIAVVSNFDARLPAVLEGLGLSASIEAIIGPGDAGAAKPDPRIFEHALAALGLEARQALFVGDDATLDLAAARRLGMPALDVAALATLADLPGVVERL